MISPTQMGASHFTEKNMGLSKKRHLVPLISSESKIVFSILNPTNIVVNKPEIGIIQLEVM
jgi:hypothetical protein